MIDISITCRRNRNAIQENVSKSVKKRKKGYLQRIVSKTLFLGVGNFMRILFFKYRSSVVVYHSFT